MINHEDRVNNLVYQENSWLLFLEYFNKTSYFWRILFPSIQPIDSIKLEKAKELLENFSINFIFDQNCNIYTEKILSSDILERIILSPTHYSVSEIDFDQQIKHILRDSERYKLFNFLKSQTTTSRKLLLYFEYLINHRQLISLTNFKKLFLLSDRANDFRHDRMRKLILRLVKRDNLTQTAPITILKSIIWFGIDKNGKKTYFIAQEIDYFVNKDGNKIDISEFVGISPTDQIEASISQDCQNLLTLMVDDYNTLPSFYNQPVVLKDFSIDAPKITMYYDIRNKKFSKKFIFNIVNKFEQIENIEVCFNFEGYEDGIESTTKPKPIEHKNINNRYEIRIKFKNENSEHIRTFRSLLNEIINEYRKQFGYIFNIVLDLVNLEINQNEVVIPVSIYQEFKQQNERAYGDHTAIDFTKEIDFIPQIKPFLMLLNMVLNSLEELENQAN